MDRSKRKEFVTPRYGYGTVERALGSVFGADADVQRGALRARLKHLARLGLPDGERPGKGQRLQYSPEQVGQLLVALMMQEIGTDPTVIVQAIKATWKTLVSYVLRATDEEALADGGNPVFLTLRPALMSGGWRGDPLDTLRWVGAFRRFDYSRKGSDGRPIKRENAAMFLDRCPELGWVCLHNLTDCLSRLQAELDRHDGRKA